MQRLLISTLLATSIFAAGFGSALGADSAQVKPVAASQPLALGLYRPEFWNPTPSVIHQISNDEVNGRLRLAHFFFGWTDDPRWLSNLKVMSDQGLTPLMTWQPGDGHIGSNPFPLRDIAAGKFDGYISAVRDKVGSQRILMRFAPEFNGNLYSSWSTDLNNGNTPQDFRAAWIHVHNAFGSNVQWVWNPNLPIGSGIDQLYPGGDQVDYVGLDVYNSGTSGALPGLPTWQPFKQLISSAYEAVRFTGKPVLLTEVGSAEAGGDKAQWIRDMFGSITTDYPAIQGVVWFDVNKETDWRLASDATALDAWRSAAQQYAQ